MNQYLLSVIIPHYNIPVLLEKLLSTIPKCDEIQILVVDDNSTEDIETLQKVIAANSDRKLEFYTNDTGKNSAGACRNIALDHAKGKWIVFADSDDYFLDGWYEKLKPFFSSDYEMVYYSITSRSLKTGETMSRHLWVDSIVGEYSRNPTHENEIRLRYGSPAVWHALYRRDYVMRIQARFDTQKTGEDKIFTFLCGDNLSCFTCIPDALYCLTYREGSLTDEKGFERFDRRQRIRIQQYERLFKKLPVEDLCSLGLNNAGLQMIYTTIMEGYGLRQAFRYWKMERNAGIPLMLRFEPGEIYKQLVSSLRERIKG